MKRSHARSQEAIDFAQSQRKRSNEFASIVWHLLRDRQIRRQKFRREYPIAPYTVDFCCVELKLVIEVDGENHLTEAGLEHDRIRDRFLRDQGYRILRILGYDVVRDAGQVIECIQRFVDEAINNRIPTVQNLSPPPPLD